MSWLTGTGLLDQSVPEYSTKISVPKIVMIYYRNFPRKFLFTFSKKS